MRRALLPVLALASLGLAVWWVVRPVRPAPSAPAAGPPPAPPGARSAGGPAAGADPAAAPALAARPGSRDEQPGGLLVAGRVVSDDGAPISGATVVALRRRGHPRWDHLAPDLPRRETDADGTFRILVASDVYGLHASAPMHVSATANVGPADGTRAPVEIRLARFVEYAGTVLDESGAPLPGAEVRVPDGGRATSGSGGAFRVAGPAVSTAYGGEVDLVATGGGRTPAIVTIDDERRDGIVLALGPPAPLAGRIVDRDGTPRAGARLRAEHALIAWDTIPGAEAGGLAVPVDEQGRFRVEGLPEDAYRLRAWATPTATASVIVTVRVLAGRPQEDLRIVVDDGVPLRGVVVDEGGAPIPGARVRAEQRPGDIPAFDAEEAVTDARGRFEVRGVPDRPVAVSVARDSYEVRTEEVDPHDGEARIVLRRTYPVRLRLRLDGDVPPDGQVISVRVRRSGAGGEDDLAASAWIDVEAAAAEIRWDGFAGAHDVEVETGEWTGGPVVVDVPSGGGAVEARLALARAASAPWVEAPRAAPAEVAASVPVSGIVVFDARPLGGWSVLVVDRGPGSGVVRGSRPEVGADGAFRVDLPPGTYTLCVVAAGRTGPDVAVEVRPGAPVSDLRLTAPSFGLAISGRVVDPVGGVPRRANVVVYPDGRSGAGTRGEDADAEGRFTIAGLDAGSYLVEAVGHGGYATLRAVPAGSEGVVLRLAPPGYVRGRVRAPEGASLAGLMVQASREARQQHSARGAADGRFSISQVPAGAYRLFARAGSLAARSAGTVTVGPGEVVRDVVLDLVPGGVIEGTLVGEDGAPAAGRLIAPDSDEAPAPPAATTDAGGRFRIEGLAPGRWRLLVMLDEARGQSLDPVVDVEAGRTSRATFTPAK